MEYQVGFPNEFISHYSEIPGKLIFVRTASILHIITSEIAFGNKPSTESSTKIKKWNGANMTPTIGAK